MSVLLAPLAFIMIPLLARVLDPGARAGKPAREVPMEGDRRISVISKESKDKGGNVNEQEQIPG